MLAVAKELRSVAAFGQRVLEGVMSASQHRRPVAPYYGREAVIKTCSSQTSDRLDSGRVLEGPNGTKPESP